MQFTTLEELVEQKSEALLADWQAELDRAELDGGRHSHVDLSAVLQLLQRSARDRGLGDRSSHARNELNGELELVARSYQEKGLDWEDVSSLFSAFRQAMTRLLLEHVRPDVQLDVFRRANRLLDELTLEGLESYLKARDVIIERQQREVLELSVPVTPLWPQVLVLPLIGSLDSHRAHIVLETLLTRIDDWGAKVVLIDITGASTVDTTVAQNLIKTVTAARLMGTECIITGIRPQIAQTIVHLGINLDQFETKATLSEGLELALKLTGYSIVRDEA